MGEEKGGEDSGSPGLAGLILGGVSKPNGQQGGFWQEVIERQGGKEGWGQTAAYLYPFFNLDKHSEGPSYGGHHPKHRPQAWFVTPPTTLLCAYLSASQ